MRKVRGRCAVPSLWPVKCHKFEARIGTRELRMSSSLRLLENFRVRGSTYAGQRSPRAEAN